jgi:NFU1 iron-sulfur cluster scaffold homolog, mitochondrial
MLYTEATPNPATLKFVTNRPLLPNDYVEYETVDSAQQSPLAQEIFAFNPAIRTVFISNNFVTITKSEDSAWAEIMVPVKSFIKEYVEEGKPLFSADFKSGNKPEDNVGTGSDVEARIIAALEKYVKPAVEMDGGAIGFVSFEEGILTLSLKGSCSGCPSSTVTLKDGIQNLLTRMVPEVKEVVAENG